jgi:hypothetical protein
MNSSRKSYRSNTSSSEHLSFAFIKRVLTPKAIWTDKVRSNNQK